MKKSILIFIFIFLIPFTLASEIFDDWVDSGETFKAGGHTFSAQYYESNQKLNFRVDGFGGLMNLGECETKDNIKYCFEDVDSSRVRVSIESLEPDISIERSFSTKSPGLNEEIIVSVTLKNSGEKSATDVHYLDQYPLGLKVYSSSNSGEWQGRISANEEESFKYTIKAQEITSFDSRATLTYSFDGNQKTKNSDTTTIEVEKPFTLEHHISTEAGERNEILIYNLTITNNDESSRLDINSLIINLPSKITLISKSSTLKEKDNALTFTGTLDKKQSKSFNIKVKSSRSGKFTIKTTSDLEISGKTFKEDIEKEFSIGLSDIQPILEMDEEVKSNSPYNLNIAIKNYGKEDIIDVNIALETDLFGDITDKKVVSAGNTINILKNTLTSPYTEEDKTYDVKISGSYISSTGRTYTFEKSAQLKVLAAPKVIKIIKEIDPEEAYPGDEIKITIKVKNLKDTAINEIDVSDAFPKEIRSSLLGKVIGVIDTLNPNEEKKAYSYSVVIPEDYAEDEIEFKTIVNAKVDDELVILKSIDQVKIIGDEIPEEIKEEQEKSQEERDAPENTEEDETTQELDEENIENSFSENTEQTKVSLFTKVKNWIKNIFKRKN